ncbi:hypothetical protein KIN20_031445 [Parelaphostrongylus tenuis]|uniref:Uncharacterized protein n=1 Tax=Parelaphostrongylus tenuis TaxID=148309 RepID=A0AAD5WH83_PARTN|nr:hypothetical protein KIN20_031445 [Parelaphostrongylus tenuis]
MKSRALVIFLIFIILFAFASAALLNALRFEHCESTLSFILLYVPLFFVNNVFVTLSAFVYWIVAEKKQTTVNRRIATSWINDSTTSHRPSISKRSCSLIL